jgi:hypothetical protein
MLRKLLKHEFRASGRIMLPMYLIVLLSAAGSNLSIRLASSDSGSIPVSLFSAFVLLLFAAALIGICIMAVVLMVQRFYKNLLCDEGYIMLTLPVSVHQHIFSKLIASTVWFAATALVVLLGILLVSFDVPFVAALAKGLRFLARQLEYLKLLQTADLILLTAEGVVIALLSGAVICLHFYAALAIGHSFSEKKVLLSIIFYFVLQMVMQTLLSLCALGPIALMLTKLTEGIHFDLSARAWMDYVHAIAGLTALITVIQGAVYYLLTAFMLKRRLNLE